MLKLHRPKSYPSKHLSKIKEKGYQILGDKDSLDTRNIHHNYYLAVYHESKSKLRVMIIYVFFILYLYISHKTLPHVEGQSVPQ